MTDDTDEIKGIQISIPEWAGASGNQESWIWYLAPCFCRVPVESVEDAEIAAEEL